MFAVKNIPIEFSKADILSYLGFKPLKSFMSPSVDELLEAAIDIARPIIAPGAVFETFEVDSVLPEKVAFKGHSFCLFGGRIVEFMSLCSKVSFVAATVGKTIDEEISLLFNAGDFSRAVALDAVGSDAVEQVISWVNTIIRQEAEKQGFRTLNRVSPGYSLWPIEANGDIAEILDAAKIGIEVLPSFEMLPRKSVMAAIGWVPKEADTGRGK